MKLSKEEQEKRINKCKGKSLAELRPDLAKEWDYEKNEDLTPEMVTCGSGKDIWWLCDKGHEYVAKPISRKRGDGCYYCSEHRVLSGFNDLYTKYPLLASEWDYTKNEVSPQHIYCLFINHETFLSMFFTSRNQRKPWEVYVYQPSM